MFCPDPDQALPAFKTRTRTHAQPQNAGPDPTRTRLLIDMPDPNKTEKPRPRRLVSSAARYLATNVTKHYFDCLSF